MNLPDPFLFHTTLVKRMNRLNGLDLSSRAKALALQVSGEAIVIPFFGILHRASGDGVFDERGQAATPAVACLILDYLLRCPAEKPQTDTWIAFREFPGAGPLMGHFTANTNKLIESHFVGRRAALVLACSRLAGRVVRGMAGVDCCVELEALPQFSMRLIFNDRDDDFPAQGTLLFRQSAGALLSLQSVAVAATWLAGRLVTAEKY